MTSLKNKILRPFMLSIISIPIIIVLLFNISIHFFSNMYAQHGLENVYNNLQENILKENMPLPELAMLYTAKNHTVGAELLLFSPDGKIIEFSDIIKVNLDEALTSIAYATISHEENGIISNFNYKDTTYYTMKVQTRLNEKLINAVYVVDTKLFKPFILYLNRLILSISFVVIVIALFISCKITNSIVASIKNIIEQVENTTFDTPTLITTETTIKEINSLSQEINYMGNRIYKYNQEQKSFLHNASHELRTPLMSIQGYAEGIEQNMFADNIQAAQIIKEESKRLSTLVDELLTLSRIENSEQKKNFFEVPIQRILLENIQTIKGYALKNQKEIILELISDANIRINEELFYQVVVNIISNAIKFASKNIIVRIYTKNSEAILEIEDDGDGIASKDLPHLFDRFYRGEKGNFGLGLSISKSAMESMGGHIQVKNSANGALFTLSFPIVA